jgi:phosphotriesterase-related protein
MQGMIQTVRGPLAPAALGRTLTHEHLLWDQRCYWQGDPEELSLRELFHQPVSIENLGRIYYHPHQNLDNIQQWSIEVAIQEAGLFKRAGGASLVDVTTLGLGRDPRALLAISEATGLNVVMGAGYYVAEAHPPEVKALSAEKLAEMIIQEFAEGVKDTGIQPGVIGEVGVNDVQNPHERKSLRAAALAQKVTGAPLYIHPPMAETHGHTILDALEQEGVDLTRVVLCHCDPTLDKPDYHSSLAQRGAYIEYDQFGLEFVAGGVFLPRDIERIRAMREQIARGNLDHILMSQDVAFKTSLTRYGGWGYAHIVRDLVPFMLREGISRQELDAIMIANPRRLLTL